MIDLNDVAPARPDERYDLHGIVDELRRTAASWVPRHFPNGRRDGHEWRLGAIDGRPPRKQGSCVIALDGAKAGDWIDFDGSGSGGPLSALEHAIGLTGRDLFAYASELTGVAGASAGTRARENVTAATRSSAARETAVATEIRHILARAAPLAGTVAETWLRSRGLAVPASDDLRFAPDLTHFDTKTGWPGMIGVVRDPAGTVLGVHRTYLALDGAAKAPVPKPRMALGEIHGGTVRLAEPADGLVGLAEGIETALAVMTACPALPMWAALSAGNLAELSLPDGIARVVICADHDPGGAGLDAARALAGRLIEGRKVFIACPPSAGDDFNDVLLRDGPDPVRAIVEAAMPFGAEPTSSPGPEPIDDADAQLTLPFVPNLPVGFVGPDGNRPVLRADDLDLKRIARSTWDLILALNERNPSVFRVGADLVWLERDAFGHPHTVVLTEPRMGVVLAEIADWRRQRGKAALAHDYPPVRVIRHILATPEPEVPYLSGVITTPVFGPSGDLVATPGYHAETGLFLDLPRGLDRIHVPPRPDPAAVAIARDFVLEEVFGEFPFVSDAERVHALALLLLPFVRPMISGPTPLHLVEKPAAGTGGTLVVEAVAMIATGARANIMVAGRDDEEWRKRITSKLLETPTIVLLDNIRGELDSASLAAAITATIWEDRLLQRSEIARLPVRCAWVATGNNPSLSNEIARRTVRIRLDAQTDQPWRRSGFRHPELLNWIGENRKALVEAVLTIVSAWVAEGRPSGRKTLGSFEAWSRILGGIMEVAGVGGFLANLQDLYDRVDDREATVRAFVGLWWDRHGIGEVGTADLIALTEEIDPPLALGDGSEQARRTRLGRILSENSDRVFLVGHVRLKISAGRIVHQARRWRLVVVTTAATGPHVDDDASDGRESFESVGGMGGRPNQPPTGQVIEFRGEGEVWEVGEVVFALRMRVFFHHHAHARACVRAARTSQTSPTSPKLDASTAYGGEVGNPNLPQPPMPPRRSHRALACRGPPVCESGHTSKPMSGTAAHRSPNTSSHRPATTTLHEDHHDRRNYRASRSGCERPRSPRRRARSRRLGRFPRPRPRLVHRMGAEAERRPDRVRHPRSQARAL